MELPKLLRRKSNSAMVPFVDLAFNALLTFIVLYIISSLLIQPIAKDAKVEVKGEFRLSMDWRAASNSDIDMWVEDPLGNKVWFSNREMGFLHLDRDDRGSINDIIIDQFGNRVKGPYNREVVTIRGIVPGEYVVNAHGWRLDQEDVGMSVIIELTKINPYAIIRVEERIFDFTGQEETFFRFTVMPDGSVTNINEMPKKLRNPYDGDVESSEFENLDQLIPIP